MAYTKQIWEDLPSENTPISADSLNHMEEGIEEANKVLTVVSPTEPTTGEEVWIKKSNNLFNVNTPTTKYSINSSGEPAISSDGFDYINQKIEVTGSITVSWESVITTPTIRIAQYTAGGTFISRPYVLPYEQASPVTINLDSNTDYIIVSVEHNDTDKVINLQIVKGDKELPYTPYVDKEIYVKNDNGFYELFDKVESPQYCQVQIDGNRILNFGGTQYEKILVPFERIVTKNGDFSLEGNGIKIPKGISKIKVSTNMILNDATVETVFTCGVYVSGTAKAFGLLASRNHTVVSNTWIVDVKEDDIITCAFQIQSATVNSLKLYGTPVMVSTSMLIEKIA